MKKTILLILLLCGVVSGSPLQYYNKYVIDTLQKPVVILTFDDAFVDNYVNVVPKLDSMGFKASFFTNGSFVGGPTYTVDANLSSMTIQQLKYVQSHGHDIVNHGFTHLTLTSKTKDQVLAEINNNKTFLSINHFYGNDLFALPGGAYDATVNGYIDTVVSFSRTINGTPFYTNIGNTRNFNLYTDTIMWIDRVAGTVAQYKAGIDSIHTRTDKQRVYIFLFHSVSDAYAGAGGIGVNQFDTLMRYVKQKSDSSKIQVLSLRQFFGSNIAINRGSDSIVKVNQVIQLNGFGFKNSGIITNCKVISQADDYINVLVPNKQGACTLSITNSDSKNVKYPLTISGALSKLALITNSTNAYSYTVNRSLADSNFAHFPVWLNLSKLTGQQDNYSVSGYYNGSKLPKWSESIGSNNGSVFVDGTVSTDTSSKYTFYTGAMADTSNKTAFTNSSCAVRFAFDSSAGNPVDICGNTTGLSITGTFGRDSAGAYGNSKAWKFNSGAGVTGTLATLANATKFTLEMWIKIDTKLGNNRCIFTINSGAGGSILLQPTPASISFGFAGGYATCPTFYDYCTLNDWHLIHFIYNGSGATQPDRWKMVIDGVDRTSAITFTTPFGTEITASTTYQLGIAAYPIVCLMDDFRLYTDNKSIKWCSTMWDNYTDPNFVFNNYSTYTSTGSADKWSSYRGTGKYAAFKRAWK